MIKTSKNVLHPCQCGCETPIIEETVGGLLGYRVVCPQCKNEEDGYFQDSMDAAVRSWNGGLWKWDGVDWRKWNG